MTIAFARQISLSRANDTATTTDAVLVARATRGDHSAFETLVRRYQDRVLNLARRIVSDPDATQDVAQEAFIKAYQRLPRFRGEARFSTWLYRITVNEARAYLRAQHRRRARWAKQAALELTDPAAAPEEPGPLVALLQELPEKQRVALALFYLQELSVAEIAQAAGAPTGTVKARLSRGRERLRRLAHERGLL